VNEKATVDKQDYDEKYDEAVALVTRTRQASISMIQRHMRIGYNRAARIIDVMEQEGIVGPSDGVKPREVLVRGYDENMP
jgi:S-DNA-T family DNA segregation ATPase FtsK/SpoIIIE